MISARRPAGVNEDSALMVLMIVGIRLMPTTIEIMMPINTATNTFENLPLKITKAPCVKVLIVKIN